MIFCEDCRLRNSYPRNRAYPFVGLLADAQCQICRRWGQCHEVDKKDIFQPETKFEKHLDTIRQMIYRLKCEDLKVFYYQGPKRGLLDEETTEQLRGIEVKKNEEVDWFSTYELRIKARDGHKFQELKRRAI